jgi:hypothetical protein
MIVRMRYVEWSPAQQHTSTHVMTLVRAPIQ